MLTKPAANAPARRRLARLLGGKNSVSPSIPKVSGAEFRYGTEPIRLAFDSPISQALAMASSPLHSRTGS